MIKGSRNRIPEGEHWDYYRVVERRVPGIVASMADAVKEYVDLLCTLLPTNEVQINSTKACTAVFKRSKDARKWRAEFGELVRQMFGMVLWVVLYDDTDRTWVTERLDQGGWSERVYEVAEDDRRRPAR